MRILLSYAYIRNDKGLMDLVTNPPEGLELLIDSGAFTAHNTGADIKLDDYIEFCRNLHPSVTQYIQLDVIGNKRETLENLKKMNEAGLKPLPVYTIDMDAETHGPRELESVVGQVQLHGLAFTRQTHLKRSGLYSVDSSSWTSAARYMAVFNHSISRKRVKTININRLRELPYSKWSVDAKQFFLRKKIPASAVSNPWCIRYNKGKPSFFALVAMSEYYKVYTQALNEGVRYYFAVACSYDAYVWSVYLLLRNEEGDVEYSRYIEWVEGEQNKNRLESVPWEETKRLIGSTA